MGEDTDVLSVVLYSVCAVLVLISNSIVIIVIIKSRELHLPTLWNIAFMAAWDFLLGLHFVVFIVPSKILNAFVYPEKYGGADSKILMFINTQNILNIMVALVDRYISVCWPLNYHRLMSPKRFTLAVASGVLINAVRFGILQTQSDVAVYNKDLGVYTLSKSNVKSAATGIFSLITGIIIVILLIKIRRELNKQRARANMGRQQVLSSQFTYTMYLSTLVYIMCYIPASISVLVHVMKAKGSIVMLQVGLACVLSNSLWNVFIYATTYRPFRDAFLKLFCPSRFREHKRRDIQVLFAMNKITVSTVENTLKQ